MSGLYFYVLCDWMDTHLKLKVQSAMISAVQQNNVISPDFLNLLWIRRVRHFIFKFSYDEFLYFSR